VAAVFQQPHHRRGLGPHGDNKDLSHARVCGLRGFPYCRASDVPLEKPQHSRKTRPPRVRLNCRFVRRDTRLYLPRRRVSSDPRAAR
jgi:hypothetical protein